MVLPPAVAFAGTQYNYAQGYNQPTLYWRTGYDAHDYNRVWHQYGPTWEVFYQTTDGGIYGDVENSNNPTSWPNPIGYAEAWCHNINDSSGVLWTCQTTQ